MSLACIMALFGSEAKSASQETGIPPWYFCEPVANRLPDFSVKLSKPVTLGGIWEPVSIAGAVLFS